MSFLYASFLWLLAPLVVYLLKREKRQSFSQNLRWAVLALLIVTLSRPVLVEHLGVEKIKVYSLVIALDLSVSMNANDIKPTRAKASRQSIEKFLNLKRHEKIALIGFTSNPLLLSPPTTDYKLLLVALENINAEYILTKGTSLEKLFKKVAKFKDEEKKLILFTDGGDEVLDQELVSLVQREKIKILAIGMATKEGSSVKENDGSLLKNKKGQIIVSRLNTSLRELAYESGGKFVVFSSVEATLSNIENWLDEENILNESLVKKRKQYFELGFISLSLALLLFFLSATRFSKKLLLLFLFLGVNLQAEELITREHWGEGVQKLKIERSSWGFLDGYYAYKAYGEYNNKAFKKSQINLYKIKNRSLESELLLAHTFYRQENYKQAKRILKGIKSSNKKIKQQVFYELGNCEAKMRYRDKAKNYYIKALQLGEDGDALHNLKVVLFQLKEDAFKVGYTNPSSAEKSNNKNVEVQEEKASSKKSESLGASGGTGSKKSKNSMVKVMNSDKKNNAKRTLSSKAYDLINEGYIYEEKPW